MIRYSLKIHEFRLKSLATSHTNFFLQTKILRGHRLIMISFTKSMNQLTRDYHIHSIYSPDGYDTPEIICLQALALGLQEIAITEHAEWHHGQQGFPQVDFYFNAIEQCRHVYEPLGLTVYTGIELGNPHQYPTQVSELLDSYPFDIVFGSVHWINDENIHLESCFADRDPNQVFTDYFTELGNMAALSQVDIVAHFDRILWLSSQLGIPFNPWNYEKTIRNSLKVIVQQGKILELNSKYLTNQPNWNVQLITMLRWYREENGRGIIINSDAHHAKDIIRNYPLASELLRAAGFNTGVKLTPHRKEILLQFPEIETIDLEV
jgi:histidinol-phosphatase (PHP family)